MTSLATRRLRQQAARFLALPLWRDPRTIAALWLLLAVVAALTKGGLHGDKLNNFLIFRQVYYHLTEMLPLYTPYPEEYGDLNHYGPAFALIIAPFALLPKFAGLLAWLIALAASLYAAIICMPMRRAAVMATLWIVTLELLSAMQMAQFNIFIATSVLGAYVAVRHDRPWLAALLIAVGTFVKLYGIVGLVVLLFTRRRLRLLAWLILWSALLLVLPMLLSSPDYVVEQYHQWCASIIDKNTQNTLLAIDLHNTYQNVSVLGMAHRVSGRPFSDLWILVPAALLYLAPLCRVSLWTDRRYQWGILASTLMCLVLFSTGSENSGYIIPLTGVAIWFVTTPANDRRLAAWLLLLTIIICCLGTGDLMPSPIRKGLIRPYSLKALPVLLVWLDLSRRLLSLRPRKS